MAQPASSGKSPVLSWLISSAARVPSNARYSPLPSLMMSRGHSPNLPTGSAARCLASLGTSLTRRPRRDVECGSSTPWIEAKHGDAVANDGVLFSRRKIMITYDTTPTPEFLEAYRRVTGSDDVSPAARHPFGSQRFRAASS